MHYDDVIAAVFTPSPEGATPAPTVDPSPARRLRDAIEPLAMHSVWSRQTNEAQAALGLDFMTGYVFGRASLLGRPTAGVVAASFAVFEPTLVAGAYDAAVSACDRDELWTVRTAATIASLSAVLDGVDTAEIASVADDMHDAVMAAPIAGRPLFAGLVMQPWPEDPVGRLWRACELAREHRGDSHVAACVAAGLDPIEMNVLTELWVGMPLGTYSASRGWAPEAIAACATAMRERGWLDGDELSPAGHELRSSIEDTTDGLNGFIVEALGASFDDTVAALSDWSQRCVDAESFPPDAFKRAAG